MKSSYIPILLVIFGATFYQVAQKSIPKDANPVLVLIIAYLVAIGLCIFAGLIFPQEQPFISSLKEVNWAVISVGIGAVMIEVGFLLAYRVGWNISITSFITSITVSLLLIPIGILIYKEHISIGKGLGILLCIIGLFLISRK